MSCIAIYRPGRFVSEEEPSTIPFPGVRKRQAPNSSDSVVARAKLIYANRCCPQCHSAAVTPLELNDALLNASLRIIPGTATVVAFHCNGCYHEWPVR